MHDWAGITAAAQVGGWVVYPLTLLAVLAIAIVIDRAYMFVRFASQPGARLDTLPAQHAFRRLDETVMVQAGTPLWLVRTLTTPKHKLLISHCYVCEGGMVTGYRRG